MSTDTETQKRPHIVHKIGRVKSDRMDKTITVKVERRLMQPLYVEHLKRYTTLVAHDETNEARTGDTVEIKFSKPLSKTKRWRLVRVLERAPGDD